MKKYLPVIVLMMVASLAGYQTVAYITAETTSTNVITTGSLDMELSSVAIDEEGNVVELESEITHILPGDTCSQMPYVTNTGSEDFYARVYLESTIVGRDGNEMENPLVFNIDTTKWIKDGEGWYRYANIVKSGETAPDPLFTEVYFPNEMGNDYVGSTTTITLQAQSVQAEYNEYVTSVLEVQGWPEGGN